MNRVQHLRPIDGATCSLITAVNRVELYKHTHIHDTVVTSPVNVLSQLYRRQEKQFLVFFFFGFFSRKNRLLSFCLGDFFCFCFFYDFYCMLKIIKVYIVFFFVFLFWMQQTMQMSVRLSALLEGLFVLYIVWISCKFRKHLCKVKCIYI